MLIFDIETNGLLRSMDKVHCLSITDTTKGTTTGYRPHEVEEGLKILLDAINRGEQIGGHNVINFDIPAIQLCYPWFTIARDKRHLVIDTLVMARLVYSNIKDIDAGLIRTGKLDGKLFGSQGLKAWGYRLGEYKGTYGEQEDAWDSFSDEMLSYCNQDTIVNAKLYEKLVSKNYPTKALDIEHQLAWIMAQMERNGFTFDYRKASYLEMNLRARYAVLHAKLISVLPQIPDKVFIPKRDNKAKGYLKGVPIQRYKDFNPTSRQQIEWMITKHFNYTPTDDALFDITVDDDGEEISRRLKIDDETFAQLKQMSNVPEGLHEVCEVLEEFLMISKRLGQLADGKQAWLKHYNHNTGKIHGSINQNGAVSGRATHSYPNIAQVPAIDKPYGKECRELFTVPKGWVLMGTDLSGLELRCLAHFMSPFDDGAYGEVVLNGDIHTLNQKSAGLPTRNDAKRFIYAYLYGGGDALIGSLINGGAKEGKKIKKEFLSKTPALAELRDAIEDAMVEKHHGRVKRWKRRYLYGLDGRILHCRSIHSALNLLLQSAGALIAKKWIIEFENIMVDENGYNHGEDFMISAHVHDEMQVACKDVVIAEKGRQASLIAIQRTKEFFNFKVDLSCESKVGANWAECH